MTQEPFPILYVSSRSDIGGGEIWLLRLLELLNRGRFEPVVLCPEGPLAIRVRESDVPVISCPVSHIRSPLALFQVYRHFRNTLSHFKIRLIHTSGLNVAASFFSRRFSVPEVIHIHTARPLGKWVRWHLRRAEGIIAVSEYAKRVLVQGGLEEEKITVIQNGIDPPLFEKAKPLPLRKEWGLGPDTLLVGVVGQIIPGKGLETYLGAISLLVQRGNLPIRFLIAGEAPFAEPEALSYKKNLEKIIRERNLSRHVRFVGFMKDVSALMKTLDILVLSSELPEGSSLCCLEAMAASRPVIATDVGAVPEIVSRNETGLLVPPKDARALSEAIWALASNSLLRQKMGEEGFRRIRPRFSLESHVRRIEEFYEQIFYGQ